MMVCADTARCNRGETVRLSRPEDSHTLTPCLCIRARGKCKAIDEEWARHYAEALAVAIHICQASDRERLTQMGVPLDAAYSRDRSLIVGPFTPQSDPSLPKQGALTLRINQATHPLGELADCLSMITEAMVFTSGVLSLNSGDFVLIPLGIDEIPFESPARVTLALNGRPLLDELVR